VLARIGTGFAHKRGNVLVFLRASAKIKTVLEVQNEKAEISTDLYGRYYACINSRELWQKVHRT
jgi:hypothetical protein